MISGFEGKLARIFSLAMFFWSLNATALFLDGEGYYGVRGETRFAPGMAKDRGTHQAIDQTFMLKGEARLNDQSSFF